MDIGEQYLDFATGTKEVGYLDLCIIVSMRPVIRSFVLLAMGTK